MVRGDRDAVVRRRQAGILGGGGASALRVLPAAISVGVVLAAPAAAQSVIGSNQSATVNLSNVATGASITAGTVISPAAGAGIVGGAGYVWSLSNAGTIDASSGDGVSLSGGGVANSGTISAQYDGVSLNHGGNVTNTAGGAISGGHIGVYIGGGAGTVVNSGVITSRTGDAVSLYTGGSFSNLAGGQVSGGYSGVYAGGNASSIQNAGTVSGAHFGVYLNGAGTVTNSGTISGGADGVIDVGAEGEVENTGTISGSKIGLRMAEDARIDNAGQITGGVTGVKIGGGSVLNNMAGGVIAGGTTGILVSGAQTQIFNAGTVASAATGGDAIALGAGGADMLTLGTGSVIAGDIDGSGSASEISLTGTGTLTHDITGFGAGSVLSLGPSADWTASGNWTVALLRNAGTLQPGLAGAPLNLTGNFTQSPTGTLRVVVTPAGTSELHISGTAQLGGTLEYVLAPGTYAPGNESVLAAQNGVTGNFASVTQLQADPPPMTVALGAAASTANLVIANRFTIAPSDDALFADTSQAQALDAQRAGDVLLRHAADAGTAPCPVAGAMLGGGNTAAGIAGAIAGAFCGAGGWLEASGDRMDAQDAYSVGKAGFLAGLDRLMSASGIRLGLAVGYDAATLSDKTGGDADIDTVRLGGYGAAPLGRFLLTADVLGGFANTRTTRATGLGNATARANGTSVSGGVQLGRPMQLQAGASTLTLTPEAGIRIASVSTGAFGETAQNPEFAVRGDAAGAQSVQPFIALDLAQAFTTASGTVVTPQLKLGVDYEAGNINPTQTLTTADGTAFSATAQSLDRVAGELAAGISAGRGNWALSLRYAARLSGNWSAQTIEGAVLVRF